MFLTSFVFLNIYLQTYLHKIWTQTHTYKQIIQLIAYQPTFQNHTRKIKKITKPHIHMP